MMVWYFARDDDSAAPGERIRMSVLIRVGIRKAILRAGEWVSADPALERLLNETTSAWIRETGGPRLDDREPEKTVAREMAERFHGQLLIYLRTRNRVSMETFVRKRQLEFNFDAFLEVPARVAKPRRLRDARARHSIGAGSKAPRNNGGRPGRSV